MATTLATTLQPAETGLAGNFRAIQPFANSLYTESCQGVHLTRPRAHDASASMPTPWTDHTGSGYPTERQKKVCMVSGIYRITTASCSVYTLPAASTPQHLDQHYHGSGLEGQQEAEWLLLSGGPKIVICARFTCIMDCDPLVATQRHCQIASVLRLDGRQGNIKCMPLRAYLSGFLYGL